eukprot:gene7181-7752_t
MATYSNPNDPYDESLLVKYGASMSGEDFHSSDHYYNRLGLISGIVCLFGLVAILFFVLGLYLRTHYAILKLKPLPPESEISSIPENLSNRDSQIDGSHFDEDDPTLTVDIIERVQLEEQFGTLPQAIAESIASSDIDDKDKDKYDDEADLTEDQIYELRIRNKVNNHYNNAPGVEHRQYNRYDEDEEDLKLKKKEAGLDDDDDDEEGIIHQPYYPPNFPYPPPSGYYPPAGYYQQPYPHPYPPAAYPGAYPAGMQYPAHLPSHEEIVYIDNPENAPEPQIRREPTLSQASTSSRGERRYREGSTDDGSTPRRYRQPRRRASKLSSEYEETHQSYPWNWRRKYNAIILYSLCLLFLAFTQFYAIGASYASEGLRVTLNDMNSFKDYINAVLTYSNQLITDGVSLQAAVQEAELTCKYYGHDYFNKLEASLAVYRSTALTLAQGISPLSADIETVQAYQKYYAQGAPLYLLWALGLLLIGFILYFTYIESRMSLKATVAFGTSVFIVYVLCGAILLSLTMFFGDLCSDPAYNLVTNLPSTNSWDSIAAYYTTCNTDYSSFIQNDQQTLQVNINYMYNRTTWATSTSNVCPDDVNLQTMTGILIKANQTMGLLSYTANCPNIQSVYYDMMNDGICDTFYTGIFYAWGAQLLTSFFLFWLLITSSITYQFYPNLTKLDEESTSAEASEDMTSLGETNQRSKSRSRDVFEEKSDDDNTRRDEKSDEPIHNNRYSVASHGRMYPDNSEFVFSAESHGDDDESGESRRRRLRSVQELLSYDENEEEEAPEMAEP